jgi:hypothetical protein
MSEYGQETAEVFAPARACYEETEQWLASTEASALTHAELEDQLGARGRELLRRMFQGQLDLRALCEQRRGDVAGADGIPRTRAEKGHTRPRATVFGQVRVTRMAYRAPGVPNVHPADAALNLPEEKQSHGLRKLAAAESARGSFADAAAAITRASGVQAGKRQVGELARRAAADIDAFYARRRPDPAPDDHVLALTFDGKGIVMRPEALRPATAKAAAARASLRPGCHRARRTAASGWPSWPASMTPPRRPAPRKTSSPRPARTKTARSAAADRKLPGPGAAAGLVQPAGPPLRRRQEPGREEEGDHRDRAHPAQDRLPGAQERDALPGPGRGLLHPPRIAGAKAGPAGAPAAKAAPGLHHHHHHQPAGGRLSTRRLTTSSFPAAQSAADPAPRPFPRDNQRHPLALPPLRPRFAAARPPGTQFSCQTIEQSYKQVKDGLGWADFQVRSDAAIRRHQALVNCAFSFCWAAWFGDHPAPHPQTAQPRPAPGRGERGAAPRLTAAGTVLAAGAARGARLAFPLDRAATLVAGMVQDTPAATTASPDELGRGRLRPAPLHPELTNYRYFARRMTATPPSHLGAGTIRGDPSQGRVAGPSVCAHWTSEVYDRSAGQCLFGHPNDRAHRRTRRSGSALG